MTSIRCTWNSDFAKSRPIVLTSPMTAPSTGRSRFPARPACSGGTNLVGLAMSGVLSNVADVPTGHKDELQMMQ